MFGLLVTGCAFYIPNIPLVYFYANIPSKNSEFY